MPFAPKSVHHRVHELDQRVTVEFSGQQSIQFAKRSLVRRVIVLRHAIVLLVSHLRGVALPLPFEFDVGNFVDKKIRHPRLRDVRVLQLHSEADALVVAAGKIERDLP